MFREINTLFFWQYVCIIGVGILYDSQIFSGHRVIARRRKNAE